MPRISELDSRLRSIEAKTADLEREFDRLARTLERARRAGDRPNVHTAGPLPGNHAATHDRM